jgi:hypothetical protein
MSPGNENVVTCHGALYRRRAKNAANCASACNPIDFVSAAGTVQMQQDLISGANSSPIDF